MVLKRLITIVLLFLVVNAIIGLFWVRKHSDSKFDPEILAASQRYRIDPALVKAVIRRESAFNPRAKGKAAEIGLMQIQEIAAQEWADAERIDGFDHIHCFNPATNIMAGTHYLAKVMRRYMHTDSPFIYALADYNAGRTHVLRWKKGAAETNSAVFLAQMDYPGTRKYIEDILRWRKRYESSFQPQ